MIVRALTSFSLGGGRDVLSGEVFEMADGAARVKVRQGWLEPAEPVAPPVEPEPSHPEAGPGLVTHQDPGVLTTQDPPTVPNRDPRSGRRR